MQQGQETGFASSSRQARINGINCETLTVCATGASTSISAPKADATLKLVPLECYQRVGHDAMACQQFYATEFGQVDHERGTCDGSTHAGHKFHGCFRRSPQSPTEGKAYTI